MYSIHNRKLKQRRFSWLRSTWNATKFLLLLIGIFTLTDTICPKIWVKPLPKNAKSWSRVSFRNVFAFAPNYEKTCNLQHSRGKTCHRWHAWKSGQFLLRAEKCKTCEQTKDMSPCCQWNHLSSLVSHRTVNDYWFLLVLREIRWTGGISLPCIRSSDSKILVAKQWPIASQYDLYTCSLTTPTSFSSSFTKPSSTFSSSSLSSILSFSLPPSLAASSGTSAIVFMICSARRISSGRPLWTIEPLSRTTNRSAADRKWVWWVQSILVLFFRSPMMQCWKRCAATWASTAARGSSRR